MSDKLPACRGLSQTATPEFSDKLAACRTFIEEKEMRNMFAFPRRLRIRPVYLFIAVLALIAPLGRTHGAASPVAPQVEEPRFETIEAMIPMRDGARLH